MGLFELDIEQMQTLEAIFDDPRSDIAWSCLNDLFTGLGATIKVDRDRVYVVIKLGSHTTRAVLHCRNHEEYASTHAISSIQSFLVHAPAFSMRSRISELN